MATRLIAHLGTVNGVRTLLEKAETGIEIVDQLLPEGLPAASTILLLSDPGADEKYLLAQLVGKQIVDKKSVLYVALDNFPADIRATVLSRMGKEAVDWSLLTFLDSYSSTVGVESEEEFNAKWEPSSSESITKLLSEILQKRKISLIVFDSLNTVIRMVGVHSSMQVLRVLVARTRQAKCHTWVTMNRKAFHPAIIASAQDTVDGVMELKVEEGSKEIERFLRILKMNDARHSTAWERYEIGAPQVERTMAKRPMKLFESLLNTDVKANLLTLFHNNANLSDTPEGLAKKIGRDPVEVQRELKDLVELGILKKVEVYSIEMDRDKEIRDAIDKQLKIHQ